MCLSSLDCSYERSESEQDEAMQKLREKKGDRGNECKREKKTRKASGKLATTFWERYLVCED